MRIDGTRPLTSEQANTAPAKAASGSFAQVMKQSRTELRRDALTPLFESVEKQGKRLAEHRTLENLVAYKQAIKQFLNESLRHGLQLTDQPASFGQGEPPHQLIKTIDEKVIALQDQLLDNEVEYIGILETVGEIKGLLLNLYM